MLCLSEYLPVSSLDFLVFVPAGGFTFYKGYEAACKRPADPSRVFWYRVYQSVLCVLWLIFSIAMFGCFDGWTRIGFLRKFDEGAARFCIFLVVLEALGFTASCVLGLISICQVGSVCFLCPALDDRERHRQQLPHP